MERGIHGGVQTPCRPTDLRDREGGIDAPNHRARHLRDRRDPASARCPRRPRRRGTTLVLPFRTVGTSDTTATVTRDLLAGELETLGLSVVGTRSLRGDIPSGTEGCDEVDCALSLASQHQATQVGLRFPEPPRGQDRRARSGRASRGGARRSTASRSRPTRRRNWTWSCGGSRRASPRGRADSDRATIDSVTGEETKTPRRREGRSGIGFRAGFLFPVGDSYGGKDRLTNLRLAYKFEGHDFLIESTAILGLRLGRKHGRVDAVRCLRRADLSGSGTSRVTLGGGLGMRSVRMERTDPQHTPYPGGLP